MTSVSVLELARKVLDLLGGVKEGEAIELSKLRDGSVLLRRAGATST
jgi:antitoxin (DNA-binding transcriptional repressor) of toxin-antitoxin stability system